MLEQLKFSITADARVAAAFGRVKSELGGVKGVLAGVTGQAERAARNMRNIGLGLTAGVTAPLAMFAKTSVTLYDTQIKAEKAVQQVIKSTGQAAGLTAKELFNMASGMQQVSNYGDEDILQNVTAPLLTFTKIAGPTFERAQQSVLDMATLMQTDLKSASIQVGKALNDPIKGVSALAKAGVQFTDDQKDMIKALVETGDVAGAQVMILKELETQFGGQAKAAADGPLGQLNQLSMAFGDLREELGREVVPFLVPLVEQVKEGVAWFAQLSPEVKQNIVIFGGLAAAVGPLLSGLGLTVLGIGSLTSAFTALATITLAHPVIAALAAVAAGATFIYANWENLPGWWDILWGKIERTSSSWTTAIGQGLAEWTPDEVKAAWDLAEPHFQKFWIEQMLHFDRGWQGIKALLSGNYTPELIFKDWKDAHLFFTHRLMEVKNAFSSWWASIKSTAESWIDDFKDIGGDIMDGLVNGITDRVSAARDAVRSALGLVTSTAEDTVEVKSPSRVFQRIGGFLMEGLGLGIRDKASFATKAASDVTADVIKATDRAAELDGVLASGFARLTMNAKNAKQVMSELLGQLAEMVLNNAFKSLFSGIGAGGFLSKIFGFADGGAFQGGNVIPFATGGVVGGPTLFPIRGGKTGLMGEAGPEAIMPLARGPGGKLGVRATMGDGGGGGTVRVAVEVYVNDSGKLAAIARQEGANAAVPVTLRILEQHDESRMMAEARR